MYKSAFQGSFELYTHVSFIGITCGFLKIFLSKNLIKKIFLVKIPGLYSPEILTLDVGWGTETCLHFQPKSRVLLMLTTVNHHFKKSG